MKRNKEKVKGKGMVKKIVLSILGVFLLVIVLGISILTSIVGTINKEYKVDEIVIGEGQKTALVIYQPNNELFLEHPQSDKAPIWIQFDFILRIL